MHYLVFHTVFDYISWSYFYVYCLNSIEPEEKEYWIDYPQWIIKVHDDCVCYNICLYGGSGSGVHTVY